jgi:hypothetical protein
MLVAVRCALRKVASILTVFFAVFGSQPGHHPRKDAFLAPARPPAARRLVRTVGLWDVPRSQAITIEDDNAAQDTLVFNLRLAKRRRKKGVSLAICSSVSQ